MAICNLADQENLPCAVLVNRPGKQASSRFLNDKSQITNHQFFVFLLRLALQQKAFVIGEW
jgi:hypothetical protein